MHTVLRNLLAPELLIKKSYEELVGAMKCHYGPKPLVIAEFYYYNQAHGETVSSFVAELRRLMIHCEIGANLK